MQTSESVDVSLNPGLHLFESLFSHLENGDKAHHLSTSQDPKQAGGDWCPTEGMLTMMTAPTHMCTDSLCFIDRVCLGTCHPVKKGAHREPRGVVTG